MPTKLLAALLLTISSFTTVWSQDQTAAVLSAIIDGVVASPDAAADDITSALDFVSEGAGASSGVSFSVNALSSIIDASRGFLGFYTPAPVDDAPEGPLSWGKITSGFGFRKKFNRMHKGIDIAMAVGDSVRVVMPGVVDCVNFERNGYGCYVVVKHSGGYETRYAHLSSILVMPGQKLDANQVIALSGNSGKSTGPHLHFELRHNGTPLDPTTMFTFKQAAVIGSTQGFLGPGNLANPCQYILETEPD
ncbi:MAG: M23 family metallopeptidase [Muribaculaceae bacterium]|nr:M23 family metallopeptidase [Muribaculaceae bacterium]